MTEKLKPCPFCGEPAVLDTYYDFYRVRCDYPECPGNVKDGDGIWYGTIEHAVQRWNTRVERTCKNVHEPPKGTTFWPAPHFKCSRCGAVHVSMDYVFYCPNCGAKVVEQ